MKKRPANLNPKNVFLDDNAESRISRITQENIMELGWSVLSHQPYSHNLASISFFESYFSDERTLIKTRFKTLPKTY